MNIKKNSDSFNNFKLWFLLACTEFATGRLFEVDLVQIGLTQEQASILMTIKNSDGWITIKEVEKLTMRQHHSIYALVNRMMRMGLITKDKKAVEKGYKITMTQKGEALHNKINTSPIEMAFAALKTKEKQKLVFCLQVLYTKARSFLEIPYNPSYTDSHQSLNIASEDFNKDKLMPDYMIWLLLNNTVFTIGRIHEMELAQIGLTQEQASVLMSIQNGGGWITIKELEKLTMRQHHSVYTLVNRMISAGLITKERKATEKKFKIVMTQKGKELHDKVKTFSVEMVFSALKTKEKQKLVSFLWSLYTRARSLLGIPYNLSTFRFIPVEYFPDNEGE